MISATSNLVILALAGPAAAVAYAMTARLADVLMQMSWQVPDAGLVGLAQLKGEGRAERAGEITVSILRLTLIGAGAVACSVLAFNPSFVSLWVGADQFAGLWTNALLAAGVVALSFGHSLFSTAATLGARVQIGFATIAQGVVHLGAAILLGRLFGLPGVAAAAVIGTLLVAYPAGVFYLRRVSGLTHADLWRRALGPWAARAALLMLVGTAVGIAGWRASVWPPLFAAPVLGIAYVWLLRPLYAELPLPTRARLVLARLRLVPEHGGAGVPLP
jgi:O-antigen/teichoic acid export membrane protein